MLVREKSGPFEIEGAFRFDGDIGYESLAATIVAPQLLLSQSKDFLPVTISSDEQKALRMGQRLPLSSERLGLQGDVSSKLVLAICADTLVALCKLEPDGDLAWKLKPEVVVPNAD